MDGLSAAASVVALIQIAGQIYDVSQQYIKKVKHARDEIDRFQHELKSLQTVLESLDKLLQGQQASRAPTARLVREQVFKECHRELTDIQSRLEASGTKRFMRSLKWPFTSEEIETKVSALQRFRSLFDSALQIDQMSQIATVRDHTDRAEEDRLLSKLPYANGASYISADQDAVSYCLNGTRTQLIDQIMNWAKHPNGKNIYWLYGMAGTGKSTIAKTVARNLDERKALGASFFFSQKKGGDLLNANKFFATIAAQLAQRSRPLREAICKAIDETADADLGLQEQWRQWVLQPLLRVNQTHPEIGHLILVIDALDECQNDQQVQNILQTFATSFNMQTIKLLVFVTSRPDIPIRFQFREMPEILHFDLALHDVPAAVIEHDIRLFLNTEMTKIRHRHRLSSDWPSKVDLSLLVEKCGRLFIYASTACSFIGGPRAASPKQRLASIIKDEQAHGSSPENLLDRLYLQVLSTCLDGVEGSKETDERLRLFQLTAGTVVTLFEPLLVHDLGQVLQTVHDNVDEESILLVIDSLHAVFTHSKRCPIQFLHPSFRDFIFEPTRCEDLRFQVNKTHKHDDLLGACIKTMQTHLRKDICNLGDPTTRLEDVSVALINQRISAPVKYACRYWVKHFISGGAMALQLERVAGFLRETGLFWIEAFILLGRLSDCILALLDLEKFTSKNQDPICSDLAYDMRRFILTNRNLIEENPLQVYISALIFAPSESFVARNHGHLAPDWFHVPPQADLKWDNCMHILTSRAAEISRSKKPRSFTKVEPPASPKGASSIGSKKTATGREEIEPSTGESMDDTDLSGPNPSVSSSTFEASSIDQTHTKIQRRFGGQLYLAGSVAFSEDGFEVAHTSDLKTFEIWSIRTGALEERFYIPCVLPAGVRTLSPNGNYIAVYTYWTGNFELIDTRIMQSQSKFFVQVGREPHHKIPTVFSPDSNNVLIPTNNSISVWNSQISTLKQRRFPKDTPVRSVVFSPDGELIAIALGQDTVSILRCCDLKTSYTLLVSVSELSQPSQSSKLLEKDVALTTRAKLAFSATGRLLVHVGLRGNITVWDLLNGTKNYSHNTGASAFCDPCFSKDEKLLAYKSRFKTINVWDIQAQAHIQRSSDQNIEWKSLAFSPSGTELASSGLGETEVYVKIWNLSQPASTQDENFDGDELLIRELKLSPNTQYVACRFSSKIQIWNTATNLLQHTLPIEVATAYGEDYILFTSNSQIIAAVSDSQTVTLWDIDTGIKRTRIYGLAKLTSFRRPMTLSRDSSLIALLSKPSQLQIRNVLGELLNTLETIGNPHEDLDDLANTIFSNSRHFVALRHDRGIKVWDLRGGDVVYNDNSITSISPIVSFTADDHLLLLFSDWEEKLYFLDFLNGSIVQKVKPPPTGWVFHYKGIISSPAQSQIVWQHSDDHILIQDLKPPFGTKSYKCERIKRLRYDIDGQILVNERTVHRQDDEFSLDPELLCFNWKGKPVLPLPDTLSFEQFDAIGNVYVFGNRFRRPMIFNFKTFQEFRV